MVSSKHAWGVPSMGWSQTRLQYATINQHPISMVLHRAVRVIQLINQHPISMVLELSASSNIDLQMWGVLSMHVWGEYHWRTRTGAYRTTRMGWHRVKLNP